MKVMSIFALSVLIGVPLFSPGQERMTKMEAVVRDTDSKLMAALLEGDSASVDRIIAEDYIEISAQGLVSRKPEIMAMVRARAKTPRARSIGLKVTIDEINLRIHGDTAVITARTSTRHRIMDYQALPNAPQPAAPAETEQERFMRVYFRRDGRWQLVASTTTAIAKRYEQANPSSSWN